MSGWTGFGDEKESVRPLRGIEVRWGLVEDEPGIADLLELNGKPRAMAFEERFIVAEEQERLVAALQYRTYSKLLLLGLLIVDPWTEEHPLAVALYAGARELAREMGVIEVLARPVPHVDPPYETGYRWWGRGWWLDTSWPSRELPEGGWRRAVALLGILAVPFHRAFGD